MIRKLCYFVLFVGIAASNDLSTNRLRRTPDDTLFRAAVAPETGGKVPEAAHMRLELNKLDAMGFDNPAAQGMVESLRNMPLPERVTHSGPYNPHALPQSSHLDHLRTNPEPYHPTSAYHEPEPYHPPTSYHEPEPYQPPTSYHEPEPYHPPTSYHEPEPYHPTTSYHEPEPYHPTSAYHEPEPYHPPTSYHEPEPYHPHTSYHEPEPYHPPTSYHEPEPYHPPTGYHEPAPYHPPTSDYGVPASDYGAPATGYGAPAYKPVGPVLLEKRPYEPKDIKPVVITTHETYTSFDCRKVAYPDRHYADPEAGCAIYHFCHADGKQDTFHCGYGTIFNEYLGTCDHISGAVHCKGGEGYAGPPKPAYHEPAYHHPEPAYHHPEPAYHKPEPTYHVQPYHEPAYGHGSSSGGFSFPKGFGSGF
jgi:hypothetical protein